MTLKDKKSVTPQQQGNIWMHLHLHKLISQVASTGAYCSTPIRGHQAFQR